MNTSFRVTLVVALVLSVAVCAVADPLVVTGLDPTNANSVYCGSNSSFYNSNDPHDPSDGGCNGTFTSLNTQYDGYRWGVRFAGIVRSRLIDFP